MAQRAKITYEAPAGLSYFPEFITRDEELQLIEKVEALKFGDVVMHGVTARRKVVHFGWDYGYDSWRIEPTEPIPDWLHDVQMRAASMAKIDAATLEQVLVASYGDGAGIGWHRDAPMFGQPVVGISLGDRGLMKFRRGKVGAWEVYPLWLQPRSLYLIDGSARSAWQHSLMPMKGVRYSITWRTVRHDYLARNNGKRSNVSAESEAVSASSQITSFAQPASTELST